MKTRVGKIARLPHAIREELNHRLYNGALGPQLMKWLNALPEVQQVLEEFFERSPLNRQNLTEWRQGGYEEWLRHQDRELRIQRMTEKSTSFQRHEDAIDHDLFESSARIALAELMADLDSLHELSGEERRQSLRGLTRELSRLQNAYNRSRWADLAWNKWNDRFLGPDDYEKDEQPKELSPPPPPVEPCARSSRREEAHTHSAPKKSESPHVVSYESHNEIALPLTNPPVDNVSDPEISACATKHPPEGAGRVEGEGTIVSPTISIAYQNNHPSKSKETPEFKQNQTTSITGESDEKNQPVPCDEDNPPYTGRAVAAAPPHIPSRALGAGQIQFDPHADFLRQAALRKSAQRQKNGNS